MITNPLTMINHIKRHAGRADYLTMYLISKYGANSCKTQLTFTCSKPTIKALEKGVKYVHYVNHVVLVSTLKIFNSFF